MNAEYAASAVLALIVIAYLLYALVRPERF
jgi:K+-transporting ATPase KdpF subunit